MTALNINAMAVELWVELWADAMMVIILMALVALGWLSTRE